MVPKVQEVQKGAITDSTKFTKQNELCTLTEKINSLKVSLSFNLRLNI